MFMDLSHQVWEWLVMQHLLTDIASNLVAIHPVILASHSRLLVNKYLSAYQYQTLGIS